MFYLKSRGIPEKEARALLTYGFANNVLESRKDPKSKQKNKKLIASKLGVNLGFDLSMKDVYKIRRGLSNIK